MSQSKRIQLIDTSLRVGAQTPGLNFSLPEKKRLALQLAQCAIDEIEGGIPIQSEESRQFLLWLREQKLPCAISGWARLRKNDIEAAASCRLSILHISLPISEHLLPLVFGTSTKKKNSPRPNI